MHIGEEKWWKRNMLSKKETERRWKWERSGYCSMCGECCNVNNFYGGVWEDNPQVTTDKDGYCKFFDKETRKCMIQKAKPIGCVRFPQHPDDLKSFQNCTYRFVQVYEDDKQKK